MSGKNYSVDDILNEYSKKREESTQNNKSSLDIDDFLNNNKPKQQPKPITKNAKKTGNTMAVEAIRSHLSENLDDEDVAPQKKAAKNKIKTAHKRKDEYIPEQNVRALRKSSGNTDLIRELHKLKQERQNYHTTELTPVNRKNIKDIGLDIKDKIIPKTETISLPSDLNEDEKERMLNERRIEKIRKFVIEETIDDTIHDDDDIVESDISNINDYNTIEDAPMIYKAVIHLKSTLVLRFFILIGIFVFSGFSVLANELDIPTLTFLSTKDNPVSYLFVNVLLGMFASLVSYTVIASGFRNLFKFKADIDSLCSVVMILSLIPALLMFDNPDLLQRGKLFIYIPAAILCLIFNTIGKILTVKRMEKNFKIVTGENEKYAVFQIDDERMAEQFTKGALHDFPYLCATKKTEFVTNFLKNSYYEDLGDTFCKYSVPTSVILGLITAVFSVLFFQETAIHDSALLHTAFSALAATTTICSSFAVMLAVTIPMAKASNKSVETSTAIVGYSTVQSFKDTNSILINVNSLFPEGTVDFVNLKQMSSTSIEDGILYAASINFHADSILKHPFYKMLKGKSEMLYPVDSYIYEDGLGISGWIENKRVLFGTRELMENHSIEGIPSKIKEAQYLKSNDCALYLSVSGEITTLFVVKAKANMGVKKWLKELEREEITVVMHSVDSFISLNFLSELFDVFPEHFRLLPFRFHKNFDEVTTFEAKIDTSLICSGRFQSFAQAVVSAKRIYKSSRIGIGFVLASGVIGAVISLLVSLFSSFSALTCFGIIAYHIICSFLIFAIQSFRKI